MRGGSHEEEVPPPLWGANELPEAIPLRELLVVPNLVVGRPLVGLVHDDEVPAGRIRTELGAPLLLAGELVELCDEARMLDERVARGRGLHQPVVRMSNRRPNFLRQLRLPPLDQAPGSDDEDCSKVPSQDEFADEEPGHDRFPAPGSLARTNRRGCLGSISS